MIRDAAPPRLYWRPFPLRARASLVALAAAGVLVCTQAWAQRIPAATLPAGMSVVSGRFSAATAANVMTVTQSDPTGILNWNSFDIGRDAKVVFSQPSASSVVLNRVSGGLIDNKTVIEGILSANGQVYIYNPNGVIIGRTATIDVGSLLASTLNISNSRFLSGLLVRSSGTDATLAADDATETEIVNEGTIIARDGGRIILAAPKVTNDGRLVSENGQVILAAGRQVYLAASGDSNMRGLLVEVRNSGVSGGSESSGVTSSVTNTANGTISVGTGNATLAGYAVNQQGLISATTTVENNGSIWLLARDGATWGDETTPVYSTRGGVLTLAAGSRSEVTLQEVVDTDSAGNSSNRTIVDADRTLDAVSRVLLSGESVILKGGSSISAKNGQVDVWAESSHGQVTSFHTTLDHATSNSAAGEVVVESGASIDVSGLSGTQLAMESLSMAVELRGSQLADSPLLRYGPLRGQTVYVDVRKGTSIADISADLALREYTLGELAATGGSVNFFAGNKVALNQGASINVSGGWVDYLSGRVLTSKLRTTTGQLVDIGEASKNVTYSAVVNSQGTGKRGIEAGYREGFSAGSVAIDAPHIGLGATLTGSVQRGVYQRDPTASNYPQGATLVIGSSALAFSDSGAALLPTASTLGSDASKYGYLGNIVFGQRSEEEDKEGEIRLDLATLGAAGFENYQLATGGNVGTVSSLALPTASHLAVAALGTVALNHGIHSSGGTVDVAASQISVAAGVQVDVAGRWVNDLPQGTSRAGGARDSEGRLLSTVDSAGGDISLKATGQITVGDGAAFDVSGGAQLTQAGKVVAGAAGDIVIASQGSGNTGDYGALSLGRGVTFAGYGLEEGGTLKLQGRNVYIGEVSPFAGAGQVAGADAAADLWLNSRFFNQGGFSSYTLVGGNNATIESSAAITLRQANWVLPRNYRDQASSSMAFAQTDFLPLASNSGATRQASQLTVTAKAESEEDVGRLVMEAGASIVADPLAAVTLQAGRQVTVDGSITAPGGAISLLLTMADLSDDNYFSNRSLWLGENARLNAAGTTALMAVNGRGVASGEVLDGGTITLGGSSGTAAVGHVVVEAGAELDVSGTAGSYRLKNSPARTTTVTSAGGTIAIRARESLYFNGTARGTSGGGSSAGGTFIASLDRSIDNQTTLPSGFPTGDLYFSLLAGTGTLPSGLSANGRLDALAGSGQVSANMLQAGGFDTVSLRSQHYLNLDFSGGSLLTLSPRVSLTLDAPVIAAVHGGSNALASFSADYISLGNSGAALDDSAQISSWGDARLNLAASVVDLGGQVALQGMKSLSIQASEALRLVGVDTDLASTNSGSTATAVDLVGHLELQGSLGIVTGQVYPTTLSNYTVEVTAPAGQESSIAIAGNGTATAEPYSAGGSLTLRADNILQAGVVRAPLGVLNFSAKRSLTFASDSLTSVAATGTIPFGSVINGRTWVFDFGNGYYMEVGTETSSSGSTLVLPSKQIVTSAPSVAVKAGATLDLSGGGELYAVEFVPGSGGSSDVLAASGTYAIIPTYGSAYAPVDPQNTASSGLKVGDRVYLSGGNGLAAGYYTLLPAEYALLDGAYAITVVSGSLDATPGRSTANVDGSVVMAGYKTIGNTGLGDSRWSNFLVSSGTVVRNRSEYDEYRASTFFADAVADQGSNAAALPGDGGTLVFDAGNSLVLKGDFLLGGSTGRKGKVDVSATDLVLAADDAASGVEGVVRLNVDDLMRMDAGSLLIGGRRDASGLVTVKADTVTLANDAGHALVAPDITLAAKDTVTVLSGAVIRGSGSVTPETLTVDGTLLRVTGQGLGEVVRTSPAQNGGTLDIRSGALVQGDGGVTLDATLETRLGATPVIGTGGGFSFGASKISLGDAVPAGTAGVVFSAADLTALGSLGSLSLTSYGGFDFYGAVSLGASTMTRLSLKGAGIQGFGSNAVLTADTVTLSNAGRNSLSGSSPAGSTGSLTVNAWDIVFGSGLTRAATTAERTLAHDFTVGGFALTTLAATSEVRGEGVGSGALRVTSGDLTVSGPRITAASGADATLAASAGQLSTVRVGTTTATLPVGGSLTLAGVTIQHGGTAIAASGSVRLEATDDLILGEGSVTSAAGQSVTLGDETVSSDGGSIELVSQQGAVTLRSGATVDVSGADYGGSLSISAVNTASQVVDGVTLTQGRLVVETGATLKGGGAVSQASFTLDVGGLASFDHLNAALEGQGFGALRQVRVRTGDISLGSGHTVTAQKIVLAADNGDINLAGTLDARGESGGTIKVYAGQDSATDSDAIKGNINLAASAQLLASATARGDSSGGSVELGTSTADGSMPEDLDHGSLIQVAAGALIDVSASGAGSGGRVVLRAPRVGSDAGQDVAIAGSLDGLVRGARDAYIEAFKVYETASIDAANAGTSGTWYTEATSFIGTGNVNKIALLDRLGASAFRLQAGLEIRSDSDLLVSVNETAASSKANTRGWNLNAWRFGGEPIALTLRATDDLTVSGSISDGFVKSTTGAVSMPNWSLDSSGNYSASYRLVAGADLGAANPLAVISRSAGDGNGDFTLGFARTSGGTKDQPVALIRTGTGNIDIAAGGDIVLASVETATNEVLAAQIYTAGWASSLPAGYTAPKTTLNSKYGASSSVSAVFPTNGGDLGLSASRSIVGVATNQLFTDWLFRQGQTATNSSGNTVFASQGSTVYNTAWWVQFGYFNQDTATFGGGNVSVSAGGDISNLSVSAAGTGYVNGALGTAATELGGGDVTVSAGGNIYGGAYYAQNGNVNIKAAGDIAAGALDLLPIIGLGDGSARIVAGGDAGIETVLNPTLILQSLSNTTSASAKNQYSYFSTYDATSSAEVVSLAGDVTLGNSLEKILALRADTTVSSGITDQAAVNGFYAYYPGSLAATALNGSIDILAGFAMAPAAQGQLSLLAKDSIKVNSAIAGSGLTSLVMLDVDPALIPSATNPGGLSEASVATLDIIANAMGGSVAGLAYHTSGGLHSADTTPVKLVADEGDILGQADSKFTLVVPKAAEISAGGDIENFGFYIQHLAEGDVSVVQAGGSIIAPTNNSTFSTVGYEIAGLGRLELLAGKDIDFGNSNGLVSVGNRDNAYLPAATADYGSTTAYSDKRYGADLLLAAGLTQGLKYESFLFAQVPADLPANLTEAARLAVVAAQGDGHFHRADGSLTDTPTSAEIWASFQTLGASQRQAFYRARASDINDAFFAAVVTRIQADSTNLAAFDQLIASYVGGGSGQGNINVFASQIKTLRRGNIDLFIPNGSLYAGVVSTPASLAARASDTLGIFTVSGGEIRVLAGQDIEVNKGRIFTLGGGDITLISQYGDIDAGRGAKTAVSASPPTLEFDVFGNATIDLAKSIVGSGIRTMQTSSDAPAASIYAVSPRGAFDAGDAGVGSSGNVVLVAAQVLNASNINAAGSVSGSTAVDASALGSTATAPTVQTTRAEDVARSAFGSRDSLAKALTFITVDVLGFGDGSEASAGSGERKPRGGR